MVFDLVAGAKQRLSLSGRPIMSQPARILVFDSGLGGLTVYPEVRQAVETADLIYAADDAVFPYGRLSEQALIDRVLAVMAALIAAYEPDVVVVACHTASTLVLGPLRARWPGITFVGTVPAIKPAALASTSKRISVLATPGTVAREYTRDLIRAYAGDCAVTLVGAQKLASLAELVMRAEPVDTADLWREIAPAFVDDGRRTDVIVLACTHYPLLLQRFIAIAPWPVTWIDPAPAIARQVERVLDDRGEQLALPKTDGLAPALFTSNKPPGAAIEAFLFTRGLRWAYSPALATLDGLDRSS